MTGCTTATGLGVIGNFFDRGEIISPHGFFDRGVEVGAVAEDEVDIVELETGQRCVSAFDDVFPRQPTVVGPPTAPVDLG